jgi:hypothetical protein
MQIKHLLEAIDQTSLLTQDTYNLLSKDIDRFINANANRIFDSVGEGDYLKKMDVIDKQKRRERPPRIQIRLLEKSSFSRFGSCISKRSLNTLKATRNQCQTKNTDYA